jgi:hypothetical protein
MNRSDVEDALQKVGELLAFEGESYAIVVLGGAALNLLGLVERTTKDVDVLAFAENVGKGKPKLVEVPEQLPGPLLRSVRTVARDLGLDIGWLNAGPAPQLSSGLPPALEEHIQWRTLGGLNLGLVERYGLVFFKLHAAADQGPRSRHYQDLLALHPTSDELTAAANWAKTQDASDTFQQQLESAVRQVRTDLRLDEPSGARPSR